jgi:hypothetical protein
VRLVEGNEDRVSKPPPPRMGPGATIGHGSDSLGPHIEGKPAHVLGKDDALAPRPLAETARARERPLYCCEPLS